MVLVSSAWSAIVHARFGMFLRMAAYYCGGENAEVDGQIIDDLVVLPFGNGRRLRCRERGHEGDGEKRQQASPPYRPIVARQSNCGRFRPVTS